MFKKLSSTLLILPILPGQAPLPHRSMATLRHAGENNLLHRRYTGTLNTYAEIEKIKWLTYGDSDKISEVDKIIFEYLHRVDLL